jgi:hypothetical protein
MKRRSGANTSHFRSSRWYVGRTRALRIALILASAASISVAACGDEPESGFCDRHECVEGFDDGQGAVIRCKDGAYSHSDQTGACEGHGGITNTGEYNRGGSAGRQPGSGDSASGKHSRGGSVGAPKSGGERSHSGKYSRGGSPAAGGSDVPPPDIPPAAGGASDSSPPAGGGSDSSQPEGGGNTSDQSSGGGSHHPPVQGGYRRGGSVGGDGGSIEGKPG